MKSNARFVLLAITLAVQTTAMETGSTKSTWLEILLKYLPNSKDRHCLILALITDARYNSVTDQFCPQFMLNCLEHGVSAYFTIKLAQRMEKNMCFKSGNTLLHLASITSLPLTHALLKLGHNPNKPNEHGQTPLLFAIKRGQHHTAAPLLYYNAQIDVRDQFGDTPILAAKHAGFHDVAKTLEFLKDVICQDEPQKKRQKRA